MLEISNATVYYRRVVGLSNVELKFRRNEVVGLLGENGSGKTTLLKAIMGLVALNSGSITLEGRLIRGKEFEYLSLITEEGSSFPWLTAKDHEALFRVMVPRFDSTRFFRLMVLFELPTNVKVRAMSRGMRQKLEIAIGMSRGSKFMLMDEPFLGEDVFTRRNFIKLMISELTPDMCMVIASHQIHELEPLLSRAVVMRAGKVVADVEMEALHDRGGTLLSLINECYDYSDKRIIDFLSEPAL